MVCKEIIIGAGLSSGVLGIVPLVIGLLVLHHKLKREERELEEEHDKEKREAAKRAEAAGAGAAGGAAGEHTVVTKTNPATGQVVSESVPQGSAATVEAGHTAEVVTTGTAAGTVTQQVAAKPVEQVVTTAATPAVPVEHSA